MLYNAATGRFEGVPLKQGRGTILEQIKNGIASSLTNVANVASAIGAAAVVIGLLTGWITVGNTNAHDMLGLKAQLTEAQQQASLQYDRLNAKLDTKLGPDSLSDTVRRLSEISGQLSALDQRERTDQDADRAAIIRMQTQMEQILAGQKRQ